MAPDFIAHPAHGIGALTPDHKRRIFRKYIRLSFGDDRVSLAAPPQLDAATMAAVALGKART